MLATFNGTWDWTAVGTLALALATFVSLFFARRALNKTQAQIELGQSQLKQTQEDIELSRKEVEEAHRPVVVPVLVARVPASTSVSSSRETLPGRPCLVDPDVLAVPVQNIGSGPALNVEASITRVEGDGSAFPGPREREIPGTVAGIGTGDITPIEIFSHGWEERWNFELTVTYDDVAGKGWRTVGRWNADDRRYTDLTINTQAEAT
ncbi:MAG TPA: hypothetical protein VG815_07135 [Chloroflexota bacterium]|jgi:hypothetical protein|nr:hypothetical protein [Chloroflexota bacterium]